MLPETTQLLRFRVPLFEMPPPDSLFGALPLVTVKPEIVTVKLEPILNTRLALLPETVNRFAPGPLMVRFELIESSPEVSVIVRGVLKTVLSKRMSSNPGPLIDPRLSIPVKSGAPR